MKKIVLVGDTKRGKLFLFVEIKSTEKGQVLSVSGVQGPYGGDCRGSAGQCIDAIDEVTSYAEGITQKWCEQTKSIWKRWHLNDMRAGCEHQRDWNTSEELTVTRYSWGDKYHELRRSVEGCTNPADGARFGADLARINAEFEKINLHGYTSTGQHKWNQEHFDLFKSGFIKEDKKETKKSGWTYENEHERGILCKPCPVCGYKYGNAWLFERLSDEVIEWFNNIPNDATDYLKSVAPQWAK